MALNQINILAAYTSMEPNKNILIWKLDNVPTAQRNIYIVSNSLCQRWATRSGKDLYIPIHNNLTKYVVVSSRKRPMLFDHQFVRKVDPRPSTDLTLAMQQRLHMLRVPR